MGMFNSKGWILCTNVTASVEAQFGKGGHHIKAWFESVSFNGKIMQPDSRIVRDRIGNILKIDFMKKPIMIWKSFD